MLTSSNFLTVCIQCKAFCCNMVKPPITEQEKLDILEAGFKDCFVKVGKETYAIKSGDNEKCPYLKDDYSCEIHKVKPKLCKIWPVIPCYKNNERSYIVIKCPLFSHISEKEIQKAKKEAGNIPLQVVKHLWNISPETKQKYKIFEYEEI